MVPATVVAPVRRLASTTPRSRREHFTASWACASASISCGSSPGELAVETAIVAGTAPPARISASTAKRRLDVGRVRHARG